MFRKGGTPNEGIMSGLKETRPGYATGVGPGLEQIIAGEKLKMSGKPYYTEPYIQNKFDDYKSKFFAIPTEKIDMAESFKVLQSFNTVFINKKIPFNTRSPFGLNGHIFDTVVW